MNARCLLFACVALLLLGVSPAHAQEGTLDPSFWSDGRVVVPASKPGEFDVSAVIAAPDGALVVVARRQLADGTAAWVWLRFTDSTMGAVCAFAPPSSTDVVYRPAGAFDSQGRLVVAGSYYLGSSNVEGGAVRFLYPDCTPDASFGTLGFQQLDLTDGFEVLTGLAIDALDRLVLGGMYLAPGVSDALVIALGSDGAPRVGEFGAQGWVRFDALGAQRTELPIALALQPDGKPVLLSLFAGVAGAPNELYVARLLPDGDPDPTFGSPGDDGVVVVSFAPASVAPVALALDPATGRLAVAGSVDESGQLGAAAMAMLLPSGALDASFDGDGRKTFRFASYEVSSAVGLDFDGAGRVVVAGTARNDPGSDNQFAAARLLASGGFDGSFGAAGFAIVPFDLGNPPSDSGAAFTLQGANSVIAGNVLLPDNTTKPGLARLDGGMFSDAFESGTLSKWSARPGR